MKIDGTEKVAKMVRERATEGGWVIISAELLRDANTDYQRVYSALGGLAGGWDVVSSLCRPGGASFHVGCVHAEVREEFARIDATRYEVTTTCTRCQERWTTTRRGGETARSRTVRRPLYLPKDEPEARDPKGGEGQGEGQNEGQDEDRGRRGQDQGGGGGGKGGGHEGGEGQGGEDQGQGQGEGQGEGQGGGQEGQGGGQEGEGQGEEGQGEGEGEEGGGQPPPNEDPYIWAFKQHWERSLTGPQKAGVYRRLTLFVG
jgi:hypothetical protein